MRSRSLGSGTPASSPSSPLHNGMPAVEMLEEQVEEQVKYENITINNAYFTVDVLFLLTIHNNL